MIIYIYFVLFIVFIGDQCSSASLGHDDIDIVDTKAKSDQREVEGRVITGDACEYIMLCDIIKNAGCDDGKDDDDCKSLRNHFQEVSLL